MILPLKPVAKNKPQPQSPYGCVLCPENVRNRLTTSTARDRESVFSIPFTKRTHGRPPSYTGMINCLLS